MPKQVHEVPGAPRPIGPYSVATEANGFVFLSGQVALDPESNEPVHGDVEEQTHQVMRNIGRVLDDLGLGYDDIVKTTIYLDDIGDFPSVNGVYEVYLSESRPARSTVEVAALPGGFLVEIEVIAAR
ncbi:MAG: reactive intermediate/imine deaminase [Acidobacteria bacterium]|nr:reactive intermediate/imine deaminase [Acidobacteriota bacterium]